MAILANSYQDELKRVSIEELRSSLAHKKSQHHTFINKPTQAQVLRDKESRLKYIKVAKEQLRGLSQLPDNKEERILFNKNDVLAFQQSNASTAGT